MGPRVERGELRRGRLLPRFLKGVAGWPLDGAGGMERSAGVFPRHWILSVVLLAGVEVPVAGEIVARREGHQVVFRSGVREMFRYQAEPGELPRTGIPEVYRRGGYLHPLYSPSGRRVTEDFPINHVHHHGVWSPWTHTEFEGRHPDFWNMGDRKGRVEFVALERIWSHGSRAGFVAKHRFVDLLADPPKAALDETWEVIATETGGMRPAYQLDWTSTQTCAGESPLKLPQYHYGGLGIRGHQVWNGSGHGLYRASGGETNRIAINATRSRWFWMGGPVDGGIAGIVVLCHPANFRFPQPMRLHPEEPFFCYAPQQLGAMEIRPDVPYIARYRLLMMDGHPDAAELDALWEGYAGGR